MFPTQCTRNAWRTRVETTTIKGLRNSIISLEYCRRKQRSKMPRLSAADRFHLTNDRPRSGRPRVTNPAQDRFIQPQLLLDKCLVSEEFRTKPSETVWEKLEFAHIAQSLDQFCNHNTANDVSNGATQYGGGTWWTGDVFGSAMNRVSCLNGVMEGNVFMDVGVLRPTAFAK